jgi:hypothetical protein
MSSKRGLLFYAGWAILLYLTRKLLDRMRLSAILLPLLFSLLLTSQACQRPVVKTFENWRLNDPLEMFFDGYQLLPGPKVIDCIILPLDNPTPDDIVEVHRDIKI